MKQSYFFNFENWHIVPSLKVAWVSTWITPRNEFSIDIIVVEDATVERVRIRSALSRYLPFFLKNKEEEEEKKKKGIRPRKRPSKKKKRSRKQGSMIGIAFLVEFFFSFSFLFSYFHVLFINSHLRKYHKYKVQGFPKKTSVCLSK